VAAERVLDVSRLDPPEPFPLYAFLDGTGFGYRTVPGHTTAFEVYIWRQADTAAAAAVDAELFPLG
jgi:hypothetical protein